MHKTLVLGIAVVILLVGCATSALDRASRSYQADRDYASLETLYRQLSAGMDRAEVEALLGEPDYSPIEGQYYYGSDRRVSEGGRDDVPVGVVVDYRDGDGTVTDSLQTFVIGPIAE